MNWLRGEGATRETEEAGEEKFAFDLLTPKNLARFAKLA
ncbi:hypothetical protein AVDCRST_MAG94-7094 [uncultured Leptolyngbya sp.]|uniref:Uncharacterized protein n=1 Tax=uncultured Leptolyngbya sp. TaxID=332963 RepID=A0A6J4PV57_9CYAN|nr:hypothetical protein AVDCRST_MAG94-7094 [uncultured Leptolyngbya sp.]